ncbi:MAG: hypothetical protein U9P72_06330, partial [Campylobacterota bacterium]|nr:hypothetical protein [Campylobacterota bacterium]
MKKRENKSTILFSSIVASMLIANSYAATEPFTKVFEVDADKNALYSAGDQIFMQFRDPVVISELSVSASTSDGITTWDLGSNHNVSAIDNANATVSAFDMFGETTNSNGSANTFILTLGDNSNVSLNDWLHPTIDDSAFNANASFPLLAIKEFSSEDIVTEIQNIRDEFNRIKDTVPDDMREVIEKLFADIDALLEATSLDEDSIVAKLAEISAMKDMMGDEDAKMYGANASKITGSVQLPTDITLTSAENCFDADNGMPLATCNAVFIDLMGVNDEWLGSTMVEPDGSYNLYFRELAESEELNARLQVHIQVDGTHERFFRDFGDDNAIDGTDAAADSFKSDMEVEWIENTETGMWNPDVNHLAISSASTTLDLDVSNMDGDKYVVEGSIKVPEDFTPGEILGSNGEWLGFQMVNLTAINTTTGEHYWTEIGRTETSTDNDTYPFKFKLPNSSADYIFRIEKMSDKNGAFEWVEMYLNDGSDNEFDAVSGSDDSLVGATGVMWDDIGSGIWIPDTTKTGYFTVSNGVSNIAIDITTFGSNFYKIEGSVTPPSDFDKTSFNDNINIDILDAKTGWWLGSAPVVCDSNGDCTYSVILGDTLNDYDGAGAGGYIIQMNQNHWDNDNWENSWWKNFYFDLGEDNTIGGSNSNEDTIKDQMDVRWIESDDVDSYGNPYWKPDVNHLHIASGTAVADVVDVNISFTTYTAPTTFSVSGTITGIPQGAKWANVHMYDPVNYTGNSAKLNADGTYTINNVKEGKYILELHYDVEDGGHFKHYQYVITDDDGNFAAGTTTAVDGMDIKWAPYASNGTAIPEASTYDINFDWASVAYWAPEETTNQKVMLDVHADVSVVPLAITQATFYNLVANVTGLANSTNVNFNLFVPNEPIGRWENNSSASDGTTTSEVLKDLKARDDYQLQIWVDGLGEFWYEQSSGNLISDVTWVGMQNGAVCENWKTNTSTCDWNALVEWKPNLAGFSINTDTTLNLAIPDDRAIITATFAMGADDANKTFDVNMWQHNDSGHAWESFEADSSGEVVVSMSVKQGTDYRMEVYNPATWEGFVVDLGADNAVGGSNDSLITNQNSWATDGAWGPKASTLIDAESGDLTDGILALGTLTPPTLKTVSFAVANLAVDENNASIIIEDIWIGLENNTTHEWYGNGNADWSDWTNPTFSDTVNVKVPANSDDEAYFVHIYPMIHKAGMVDTNGSGQGVIAVIGATPDTAAIDFTSSPTTTVWDIADADTITIANETNVSVTLKAMNDYKSISGTITLNGDVSEAGWICATAPNDGKCSEVESDGSYVING